MAFFLKKIIKILKTYFIIIGILTSLVFLSAAFFIKKNLTSMQSSLEKIEPLKEQGLIHIKWSGTLQEGRKEENPFDALLSGYLNSEKYLYTPNIEAYLKTLGEDSKVEGLFIELGSLEGSLFLISELRNALINFKNKFKKPIYFWLIRPDTKSYYLASVANEIILARGSTLQLLGPVINLVYFGEALKKIGVSVEIIKNGSYKASFEPFAENTPSAATKEMYTSLEASIRNNLILDINKTLTHLSQDDIKQAFQKSFLSSQEALSKKLVSELLYLHEAKEKYETKHKASLYPLKHYLATNVTQTKKENLNSDETKGIALIEAIGTIYMNPAGGKSISPEAITKELTWARENKNIKAVVLRIVSPGGDSLASDLIWEEVRRLSETKPLVVSMGSIATSGGYYIAAPAHKIFASPYTTTGSIGVINLIANFKNFEEKYGVSFFVETQSDRKALLSMGEEASREDKNLLLELSNKTYGEFLEKVSLGRKLSHKEVLNSAEGRIWSGSQAKNRKLVDEIGNLKEALLEAKILAGFKKEDKVPVFHWKPKIRSFSDCFQNSETMKKCFSSNKNSLLGQAIFGKTHDFSFSNLSNLTPQELKNKTEKALGYGKLMALWPYSLVLEIK